MCAGPAADPLEDRKMGPLTSTIRCVRKSVFPTLMLVVTFALATTLGFARSASVETIRATYAQAGNVISVTLVVYNYSTSADLQVLSLAFQEGQDRELAAALSKTKAVGHCTITGDPSFEVAFIQMVLTPTGRQITFIANRPLRSDEVNPSSDSQSFDLMVGEFDINDTDNTKSTGFLYPATRLVVNEQGESRYDLAGIPWSLVKVLDSNWAPALAEREPPDVPSPLPGPVLP